MPIGRYFAFAGSLLVALLFLADWYLPELSAAPERAGVDKSIIRIHTKHRWPEAMVFDTSLPTIVPPPVIAAGLPVQKTLRDAFALLPASPPATAVLPPRAEAMQVATKRKTKSMRVAVSRRMASYRAVSVGDVFMPGW